MPNYWKGGTPGDGKGKDFMVMGKQSIYIVLAVAAMFVLVLVVVYIASAIKKTKLRDVVMHQKIIALDNRDVVPYKVSKDIINLPTTGQEYSYSLWLYLSDQYEATSGYKVIFQRGNASTVSGMFSYTTNPLVLMDKNTNRLYVAISTNKVTRDMTADEILQKDANGAYTSSYVVAYIDYVPLQRWVNISIIVKDDKLMLFMDADMYTVATVSDVVTNGPRPVMRDTTGDALIGDKRSAVKGYISYSRFFNYAMTQNEVRTVYEAGPTKRSILAYLGLNNYGFRTPIYNMDDEAKSA